MLLVAVLAIMPPLKATHAADPLPYDVAIAPTGQDGLDAALTSSSTLVALRGKAPAGPFALVARARGDIDRLHAALASFGYYAGSVAITIDGLPLDETDLPDLLAAYPDGRTAKIDIAVTRGEQFVLGDIVLIGDVAPEARRALQLKPGDKAVATDVLAAQARMQAALDKSGHALAKVDAPKAVLNPDRHTLDIAFDIHSGPRVDLGRIDIAGNRDLTEAYIRRRLNLHTGDHYDPAAIQAAREDLSQVGAIAGVRIAHADALDDNGQLPVQVAVTERKLHAVNLGGAYSTDLGASVNASWTDRNLFGNAETLTLSAAATQLGASAAQQPGYNFGAVYTIPDWLEREQSLSFNALAVREDLDAYDRTALILGTTFSRRLTPDLTASAGLQGEEAHIVQEERAADYTLLQTPLALSYDSAHELFNPDHGVRAGLTLTPSESVTSPSAFFLIAQASAATYLDIGKWLGAQAGRSVLALRGLVGSVQGASAFQMPPDQRFYAGGGDSVRGFRYQSIGPQFADDKPEGGTSVDTASVEFRQRFGESYGAAVFVDAGQVGTSSAPFTGDVRVGAGMGARYFTSIGPIRLDVAMPVTAEHGGDAVEVYIGIGQAF
jgi:translocation and assembly module TamA